MPINPDELLAKQEVRPEEVEDRAKALLKKDFPITTLVRKYAKDLGKEGCENTEYNLMHRYIVRECIEMDVPWRIFVDGAFKPQKNSFKISYHSHYSAQLYRHYAQKQGLPLQTSWRIRFKIISSHERSKQDMYSKFALYQSSISEDTSMDKEEQRIYTSYRKRTPPIRIMAIPKRSVIGYGDGEDGLCFALTGCYDIVGAAGYMYFESANKKEKFYFESNLDLEKTNLTNKTSFGEKPTPYAMYPDRIVTTKWCSKCLEAYYRPKLIGLDIDLEDGEQDSGIAQAKEERKASLEERARKNL